MHSRRSRMAVAALTVAAVAMFVRMAAPARHAVVGVSMAPGLLSGDVVTSRALPLLDRRQTPRRFERWLFSAPSVTTEGEITAVKRVMGLAGEVISIEQGDLLVDGVVVLPSPDILAEMASPVWEDGLAARAGEGRPPGWTAADAAWRRNADGAWSWSRRTGKDGPQPVPVGPTIDWLTYRHRVRDPRRSPDGTDAFVDSPIFDDAPFAPEEHRRLLPVQDVGIAAVIRVPRMTTSAARVRCFARVGNAAAARTVAVAVAGPTRLAFVAGRLDRHLVGAAWTLPADGRTEAGLRSPLPSAAARRWSLAAPWPEASNDVAPYAPPVLEFGVASPPIADAATAITVERLVVWRDIRHLPAADGTTRWSVGRGQVFLLGDFPAASRDSRQWGPLDTGRLLHRVHPPENVRAISRP